MALADRADGPNSLYGTSGDETGQDTILDYADDDSLEAFDGGVDKIEGCHGISWAPEHPRPGARRR